MSRLVPPPAPVNLSGEGPRQRVQFRLWQIVMSALTLLATGWIFTLNPIAGIVAAFIAKHVLVAILASGLKAPPRAENSAASHPI